MDHSSLKANFATVVGEEGVSFTLHERLLRHYSSFFHAALTGMSKEAEEKHVVLVEEDPLIFELFIYWLYYQRIPDDETKDGTNDSEEFFWKWRIN
jgi:hypothetical protein